MSILIIFNHKAATNWKKTLREKLPEVNIDIYPHVKDPDAVRFALCWKPEKNILRQFSHLSVVQSLGAGVEHIIQTQTLTDITVTRIVDRQLTGDMWEFLLAAVLQHLRNFPYYARQQALKIWAPKRYRTIQSTQIGVLGLGAIGGFVAEAFAKIGFRVSGWAASEKNISGVQSYTGTARFSQLFEKMRYTH